MVASEIECVLKKSGYLGEEIRAARLLKVRWLDNLAIRLVIFFFLFLLLFLVLFDHLFLFLLSLSLLFGFLLSTHV